MPATREPRWGLQAVLQLVIASVVASLLYSAFLGRSPEPDSAPPLLASIDATIRTLIPRFDRFFEGVYTLRLHDVTYGVLLWSLAALVANLLSTLLLFALCLFGWRNERARLRILTAAFALVAALLTVATAPLLYVSVIRPDGSALPIDAALASLLVNLCYLAVDTASAFDHYDNPERRFGFLSFIVSVDIPCVTVTLLFSLLALHNPFPPAFVIGTASAILAYYSVASVLLSGLNWLGTTKGARFMAHFRKNVVLAIVIGAALNGAVGTLVQLGKLPIYLDLIGTFLVGALCGLVPAMLSAALGVLLLGLTTTPIAIAYIGTAIATGAASVLLHRLGFMKTFWPTAILGFTVLGPLSTLLSVPITAYLFGGVSFAGSDAMTLFFLSMGDGLLESVFKGAIFFDALDKAIAAVAAYTIVRRVPKRIADDLRS